MKNIKQKTKTLMLVIALCLTVSTAYPQIGIPGSGGGGIDDVNDEAPISSLVLLGLAAGAVFGIKKVKSKD